MTINPEGLGDGIGRLAIGSPLGDFLANLNPEPWPTDFDAFRLRSGHPGLCSLADFLRLHLRQGRQQGQKNIADQFVIRREVRLGVGMERHAVGGQPLEMTNRLRHPLPAETVQRPE